MLSSIYFKLSGLHLLKMQDVGEFCIEHAAGYYTDYSHTHECFRHVSYFPDVILDTRFFAIIKEYAIAVLPSDFFPDIG